MSNITTIIILFLLAASGGIFMLTKVLRDKRPPRPVAYIHGLLAASAYGFFLFYSFGNSQNTINASTIFLTIAILGGFSLFTIDTLKKKVPKIFAIVHGTAAIAGIISFILYAMGH